MATVSAYLNDHPDARPVTFVGVTDPPRWDRFVGFTFVTACVGLHLLWLALLGHLLLATGIFDALFAHSLLATALTHDGDLHASRMCRKSWPSTRRPARRSSVATQGGARLATWRKETGAPTVPRKPPRTRLIEQTRAGVESCACRDDVSAGSSGQW